MDYLHRVTGGKTPEENLERFLDREADVFDTIEEVTPVEFIFPGPADYHAEFDGGRKEGRMITPDIYGGDRLGEKLDGVRESPHSPLPVTFEEIDEPGSTTVFPTRADCGFIAERMEENLVGGGRALVAGMYEALLDCGIAVEIENPATELVVDDEEVVEVVAEVDGTETTMRADGVVIAADGLEWDEELKKSFLPDPGGTGEHAVQ